MPDPIQGPSSRPGKPEGPGEEPSEGQIGKGQEQQSPFQMPKGTEKTGAPSPMEIASQQGANRIPPEELGNKIQTAQQALEQARTKLGDPEFQKGLTQDHYNALSEVTTKLNGDLRAIAENSNGKFTPQVGDPKKSAAENVLNWINGSQKTLTGALNYLSTTPKPNVASYMKMQYAVQRATQRAELFSSIVSSSVSGLKTLMSTQLG